MALIDDLRTAADNLGTELASVTAAANLKPDYSVDGRSVPWCTYRDHLIVQIREIRQQINQLEGATTVQTMALP